MHSVRMCETQTIPLQKSNANVLQLGHPIGMALVIVQLSYGFGRPAYYLTPHQFREFSKYAYGEWLQVRVFS